MDKLKSGSKVTRAPWQQGVYFLMDKKDVKSFQPKLALYTYNEDIMVSEGWLVDGQKEEHRFCDIVPLLNKGSKARMKGWWKEMFIYLDAQSQSLVLRSMESIPYMPEFTDFLAEDWIEIE